MGTFVIAWDSGEEEIVEQSDCETVEQYLNCRFGSSKPAGKVTLFKEKAVEKPKVAKEAPKPAKDAKK